MNCAVATAKLPVAPTSPTVPTSTISRRGRARGASSQAGLLLTMWRYRPDLNPFDTSAVLRRFPSTDRNERGHADLNVLEPASGIRVPATGRYWQDAERELGTPGGALYTRFMAWLRRPTSEPGS